MAKIPVGATIAQAYRFAFGDFLRILGVMWPSMVILWLPNLLMGPQMTALSLQMAVHDYSGLRQLWPVLLLFYVAALILIFVQIIGIAQLALDRHKGPVWFYFELGQPVWRLIGSFLLMIAAAIVGWILLILGGVLAGFLLGFVAKAVSLPALATNILVGLAIFVLWCGYFYSFVRLSFLLTPVVAAQEQDFALGRSWTLGLGNFWRMFAILLATLGPFLLVEMVFIFRMMFRGATFPPPHATAAQTAAYQAALNAHAQQMMTTMHHYWYVTYPLGLAAMVIFYGLCTGAQCFAYRSLTEDEGLGPVTAD